MKKYIPIIFIAFFLCASSNAGIIGGGHLSSLCASYTQEDFVSDYTEVDALGKIAVTDSDTLTMVDLEKDNEGYVYQSYGADYFAGDFTVRFIVNFTSMETNHISYPWGIANEVDDFKGIKDGAAESDDYQAVQWYENSGSQYLRLVITEDGSTSATGSTDLAASTNYYVTVTRDDDAGANSTGQLTMYVCTTAYCTGGGNLVTSETDDCSVAEQNNFQYMYGVSSHNDGANLTGANFTVDSMEHRLCID